MAAESISQDEANTAPLTGRGVDGRGEARTDRQTSDALDRITVVMVSYNSSSVIAAALGQLKPFKHVVIVDNASGDDTVRQIKAARPDIRVIEMPCNSGFGYASNLGFAAAGTDFVLHYNPDAAIETESVLRLMQTADEDDRAGAVAPLIQDDRGQTEIPVMGPYERHHHALEAAPDGPFCTWFVTAALVLWKTPAIKALHGFDPSFFLYEEDADLSRRATQAGYGLVLEPRAVARHAGGASSGGGSMKSRWRKDWNQAWSHFYYEDKHGPPGAGRAKARASVGPLFLKGLGGLLRLRPKTVIGQFARLAAAIRYLRGGPSWGRARLSRGGEPALSDPFA